MSTPIGLRSPTAHRPSKIFAEMLRGLGLGNVHTSATWPVFIDNLPEGKVTYSGRLVCTTTTPILDGVYGPFGYPHTQHAVQIRVDVPTEPGAYTKAAEIRDALAGERRYALTIDGYGYIIEHPHLVSGPLRLGRDEDGYGYGYTLNYTSAITVTAEP